MKIPKSAWIIGLLGAAVCNSARASDAEFLRWPRWTWGGDLGLGYLGHFSSADTQTAPAGSFVIGGRLHVWYWHLVAPYLLFGYGTNGTVAVGGGLRFNLFEYAKDPFTDSRAQMGHRGLLSGFIQNFMVYIAPEVSYYALPAPDPSLSQSWARTTFAFQPAAGVQWFFWIRNNSVRRFYVDLSSNFAVIESNKFLLPSLRLGAELR